MIKSLISVGGFTLISRVTGFLRDIVLASVLGAGFVADAFVVAQRLPNHFRAIFGEGAFNAAFVPAYSKALGAEGRASAQLFAGRILSILTIILGILSAIAIWQMPYLVGFLAPGFFNSPEKYSLAITLTRITFPYLLFVSIVTLLSGVLNSHQKFAVAAAAPVLLNLSLVIFVSMSFLFPSTGHAAAWGVTAAGVMEVLLLVASTKRAGCLPRFRLPVIDLTIKGFFRALGPAVIGSGGIQIALFIDTILSSLMVTGSVSAIYYADRIYQLPIGIIGIAAGTVLLPAMSRSISSHDYVEAERIQGKIIGLTLALTSPFFVAFVLMPDLILDGVFLRGAFTKDASVAAADVLSAYAVGLFPIMLIRPISAGFLARQDTVTPLIASMAGIFINILLKFWLSAKLGAPGLALATSIGAWVNFGILVFLTFSRGILKMSRELILTVWAVLGGTTILGAFTYIYPTQIVDILYQYGLTTSVVSLTLVGILGLALYSAGYFLSLKFCYKFLKMVTNN